MFNPRVVSEKLNSRGDKGLCRPLEVFWSSASLKWSGLFEIGPMVLKPAGLVIGPQHNIIYHLLEFIVLCVPCRAKLV